MRSSLTWVLGLLVIVVFGLGGTIFIYSAVKTIEQDVSSLHLEIARRALLTISTALEGHMNAQQRASNGLAEKGANAEQILSVFVKDNPELNKASLVDKNGKEVLRIDRFSVVTTKDLANYKNNGNFKEAESGKTHIDPVFFSGRGDPIMIFTTPVISLRGEFLGALVTELDLRFMWGLMSEINVGTRGKVYVVDNRGYIIADPDSSLVLRGENVASRPIVAKVINGASLVDGLDSSDRYNNFDNVPVFAAALRLEPFGWGVITEEPLSDALLASRRTLAVGLSSLLISVIFFFALIFVIRRILELNESLGKEEAHTSAVISHLTDGVIEYSPEWEILLLNPEAERLLGVKNSVLKGKFLNDAALRKEAELKSLYVIFSRALDSQSVGDFLKETDHIAEEVSITSPSERILKVRTIPVRTPDGNVSSVLKILTDVTRDKFLERMKSEFISIAAHQLRTPLSAVKWALRTVLDGDLGGLQPKQTEFLKRGYETNESMIRLVGDLLDASRIEEGRFGYKFVESDITQLMSNILHEMEGRIQEKKLIVNFENKSRITTFTFDPDKLKLALDNILANAINYTPSGGHITISLGKRLPYAEFMIKDSGVGIPDHQLSRLFTKFYRGDNVIRMQTEGSGLGLFIVKNIILAHGGKVWIQSKEGEGTSVFFTLPLSKELIPTKDNAAPSAAGSLFQIGGSSEKANVAS